MTNLSTKLKELRKAQGLSQEKLAEQLVVSRQAVSKWESGEACPDIENMIALAKLYGVSLDELVGISDAATQATPEHPPQATDDADSSAKTVGAYGNCDDDDDDEDVKAVTASKSTAAKLLYTLPYPIIATIAFLLLGILADAWYIAWILFVTIPLYYSLISCIAKRRFRGFAYPVLVTCIFLFLGMKFGAWHPAWVIFLTIPVYDPVAVAIDKMIAKKR